MPMPMLAMNHAQALRQKFAALPRDHALHVFFEEHERILGFLSHLDDLIEEFRDDVGTPRAQNVAREIEQLAKNLLAAEPHHAREEQVLFPALELRGISLPPRIMRMEHHELRELKAKLAAAAFAEHPDSEEIAETAGTLSARLRDHIAKENEVLYPMALDLLSDPRIWEAMGPSLRQIGPCDWSKDLFV
jgi:DUF438 domain-containing protein